MKHCFWQFVSKILVNLSRFSFFLEMSVEIRKFPVPFGISTRYEAVKVPVVVNFVVTKATRWRRVDATIYAKRSATVRACSWLPDCLDKNVCFTFFWKKKKIRDPARIRTWNPLIRSQMPYPLGHGASQPSFIKLYMEITFHVSKSIWQCYEM